MVKKSTGSTKSRNKKTAHMRKVTKSINIQREIEKILEQEFESMVEENAKDPLFELLRSGELERMKIELIRKKVLKV